MAGWFELKEVKNGQFCFVLKAGNAETILTSEVYATKSGAMKGIESVKKNCPIDGRYEKKEASNGKFFFVLKAANHQIIGTSQMYSSPESRDKGVESVKTNGTSKTIKE